MYGQPLGEHASHPSAKMGRLQGAGGLGGGGCLYLPMQLQYMAMGCSPSSLLYSVLQGWDGMGCDVQAGSEAWEEKNRGQNDAVFGLGVASEQN